MLLGTSTARRSAVRHSQEVGRPGTLPPSMLITSRPLWTAQTNCYVVGTEAGGPALIIDAPPDPEGVLALLAQHRFIPAAVLLTHGHVDHMGGAGSLARQSSVAVHVHPDD